MRSSIASAGAPGTYYIRDRLKRVERRNLKPDYSAVPMLFHAAIACARGSSDT